MVFSRDFVSSSHCSTSLLLRRMVWQWMFSPHLYPCAPQVNNASASCRNSSCAPQVDNASAFYRNSSSVFLYSYYFLFVPYIHACRIKEGETSHDLTFLTITIICYFQSLSELKFYQFYNDLIFNCNLSIL